MKRRVITIPYRPRELQREIHAAMERHRFSLLVAHRRFGKTVLAVNHLVKRVLTCQLERPRVAYFAPLYRQAKKVAWDYVRKYSSPIPGVEFNESELRVDYPNGGRLQLFGTDNPDSARGIYLDEAVLDEPAQMNPRAWPEVIRPALTDREGGALFIGTPQGKNAFFDLYELTRNDPSWFVRVYKASETGIIAQSELDAARSMMSDEQYAQEFECSFAAGIEGAYYAKLLEQAEREGRICRVPHEPILPVHTAWDLGIGDSTAIWFVQVTGREVRWIDYYENSGEGLAHYFGVLRDRGHSYGRHLVPHDASARELGTGRSRVEVAAEAGFRFDVLPAQRVEDGIEALRNMLARSWFDADKCKNGLDALRSYRRDRNEGTGEWRDRPLHNWASHGADAARYAAMGLRDFASARPKPRVETRWVV